MRKITVLSPGYLEKANTHPEQAGVLADNLTGAKVIMIPVINIVNSDGDTRRKTIST